MFDNEQVKKLLKLARNSIESYFSKKDYDFSKDKKEFKEKQGVFVTLKTREEELRGCIGFPYPILPLSEAIFQAARAAAFSDPRFFPLSKEELENIKIEISVLSVPEEIKCEKEKLLDDIRIGKDGLIVQLGGFSGLLLPQVALEWRWNSLEFLENCCDKAGLDRDEWKEKDCKIFKFQAQIFSE
jgi:AmmeMemoRadiSam system protein A